MSHIFVTERAKSLTDTLFSLEEPWRSRFLNLVANQATGWAWDGQPPTPDEVTTWLGDWGLYQQVTSLLYEWHRA
ncbi:MAG: hypothetical protein ACE5OS_01645 [Anaerolineae bacterium]